MNVSDTSTPIISQIILPKKRGGGDIISDYYIYIVISLLISYALFTII